MSAPAEVVTLGETMVLLTPSDRIQARTSLTVGIGGAESNVAIGLARLGVRSAWVSRVGQDDLGAAVIREIRAEGVMVLAESDPDAPTGLMVKEVRAGRPVRVRYHRSGSAASRLDRHSVDAVAPVVAAARILHLTGITPALGPGPRAAVERAVQIAREHGTQVSLDVNHRSGLWSEDQARTVLTALLPKVDLLFAGREEAAMLLGAATGTRPRALAAGLRALGPATVVVKLGERGALAMTDEVCEQAPGLPVEVVDPVGAGDAFVAGFLAERLTGAGLAEQLATGNACGGAVCAAAGDWEGMPTRSELRVLPAQEVVR